MRRTDVLGMYLTLGAQKMTVPRAQEENYTNAVTPSPGIHSQAGISNELKTSHRELLDGPGQILFGPSKQGPLVRLRFLFHLLLVLKERVGTPMLYEYMSLLRY